MRLLVLCLLLAPALPARVKTGLDVLVEQDFAPLAGKRLGVIANQNTLTWDHRGILNVMAKSSNVKLMAIFGPEHGFTGANEAGANIDSTKDPLTGAPIYSLYNKGSYRPTPEMLANLDALVFDLQDVGARFYTYPTTLGYILEAAAKSKLPVYVLDRPNPINGESVEGPLLDKAYFSMIGYARRPIRHGLTIGELAQLFNGENKIGADVRVIKMQGWQRAMWLDQTGLEWINPSPNLRSLAAVILYPGTCLVENMAISIGRGTDRPFEMFGAPWLKNLEIADYLNARNIPGVRFMARRFSTSEQPYKGQELNGIDVQLLDRDRLNSPLMGLELIAALLKFHPDKFTLDRKIMLLLGSDRAAQLLKQGLTGAEVNTRMQDEVAAFRTLRQKYLLY